MKKDIKKKWVKALKSGKYLKGKTQLKTKRGFCCLGVLTDLYIKDKKIKKGWVVPSGDGRFSPGDGALPIPVANWAGLKNPDPLVKYDKAIAGGLPGNGKHKLSHINDRTHINFKGIAKLIDESL